MTTHKIPTPTQNTQIQGTPSHHKRLATLAYKSMQLQAIIHCLTEHNTIAAQDQQEAEQKSTQSTTNGTENILTLIHTNERDENTHTTQQHNTAKKLMEHTQNDVQAQMHCNTLDKDISSIQIKITRQDSYDTKTEGHTNKSAEHMKHHTKQYNKLENRILEMEHQLTLLETQTKDTETICNILTKQANQLENQENNTIAQYIPNAITTPTPLQ